MNKHFNVMSTIKVRYAEDKKICLSERGKKVSECGNYVIKYRSFFANSGKNRNTEVTLYKYFPLLGAFKMSKKSIFKQNCNKIPNAKNGMFVPFFKDCEVRTASQNKCFVIDIYGDNLLQLKDILN